MSNKYIILILLLVGCNSDYTYIPKGQGGVLRCGTCKKIVYAGPWERDNRGLHWPIDEINYCKDHQ